MDCGWVGAVAVGIVIGGVLYWPVTWFGDRIIERTSWVRNYDKDQSDDR